MVTKIPYKYDESIKEDLHDIFVKSFINYLPESDNKNRQIHNFLLIHMNEEIGRIAINKDNLLNWSKDIGLDLVLIHEKLKNHIISKNKNLSHKEIFNEVTELFLNIYSEFIIEFKQKITKPEKETNLIKAYKLLNNTQSGDLLLKISTNLDLFTKFTNYLIYLDSGDSNTFPIFYEEPLGN